MAGTAFELRELSFADQPAIPAEEARLLQRLWAASLKAPFPLKGRPTKAEAWKVAMMLLRNRLEAHEFTGRGPNNSTTRLH